MPPRRAKGGLLVVVGAGGHAGPVLELLDALGVEVAGLVDRSTDQPPLLGRSVIASLDELAELTARGVTSAVIAVGDNAARLRLGDLAHAAGLALPTVAHPSALVSPSASLAEGVQVMARGFVGPGAEISRLALVNTGAIVEHECRVGAASHVAPGAVLCGAVLIGEQCLIGAGSTVAPGRSVGDGSIVGAGTAVVADVAAGLTVAGVPARPLKGA